MTNLAWLKYLTIPEPIGTVDIPLRTPAGLRCRDHYVEA